MGNTEQMEAGKRFKSIIIKDQETSIIEDSYLVAALVTLDPTIKYKPVQGADGKVSFQVQGKISDEMGRIYSGESASLSTYISNLKACRSAIFALRSSQRGNRFR